MAAINDLLQQISDTSLRNRLEEEVSRLTKNKKFGLVFEEHIPECTPLYGVGIKKGSTVALKTGPINDLYTVLKLKDDIAVCRHSATGNMSEIVLTELVSVARFGEPIFPTLLPVDSVEKAPDSPLWHTLIEADNYHALQLLEYLYPKQVDMIYIDPPYNTGARDWKYNNDYVDSKDSWRHSKWLSMMQKRLKIAKRILNPQNSILVIAIDDNELFSLGILLDELFSGCEKQIIDVTINPKGKARDGRLSQVDEYLIIIYIGGAISYSQVEDTTEREIRWPYLRRSDVESARGTKKGGIRQFYPIYVNTKTNKITCIGDSLTPAQKLSEVPKIIDSVPVFPIREDGKHMNWGLTKPSLQYALDNGFVRATKSSSSYQPYNFSYVTVPSIKKVEDGQYNVTGIREDGSKIVTIPNGTPKKVSTAWCKTLHDANSYGSQIIGTFLPNIKFSFPKSLYAVYDVLRTFTLEKKNALIVDFFAGSGTTLHAVNLLNADDNGMRRCILVTNNEVSDAEVKRLKKAGYQPGDSEWENQGICRLVTWPRSKHSILGVCADGSNPSGHYITSQTKTKEIRRSFYQLGFVDTYANLSLKYKKQIVSLLRGDCGKVQLPQSIVKENSKFVVSDKHTTSILFDIDAVDGWIEALDGKYYITDFYILAKESQAFISAKERISDILGNITTEMQTKRPMNQGFSANLEYFKLNFLDKNSVSLGQQFHEILPLLWLKSGAIGSCPELSLKIEPEMMILTENKFAILVDETKFVEFVNRVLEIDSINTIYFVTNSEDAFHEMSSVIKKNNTYQLYRDYIDNFVLGSRRN